MHRIDPMNRERATAGFVDFCHTKLRFDPKKNVTKIWPRKYFVKKMWVQKYCGPIKGCQKHVGQQNFRKKKISPAKLRFNHFCPTLFGHKFFHPKKCCLKKITSKPPASLPEMLLLAIIFLFWSYLSNFHSDLDCLKSKVGLLPSSGQAPAPGLS